MATGGSMAISHQLDHKPFLVKPGTKVRLKDFATDFTAGFENKQAAEEALLQDVSELAAAQDLLWASKQYAIIIIFQALDAAGKDGAIKHVMSGVNPQGVTVTSFKAPNDEERLHHFLWRPSRALPPRGVIAIFNRSYYEEVLVVRVHPEFLESQWMPDKMRNMDLKQLWPARYAEINDFERVMRDRNIFIIKFFLNVSKKEQRERFLKRLDDPEKNWKFSADDVAERAHWEQYQEAYEDMLSATSTEHAPWHVIPADKKWFARACVADIIATSVRKLDLKYPTLSEKSRAKLADARQKLEAEL
jgi:PPK2 family polyphosphate:nucleotide phosphotransferase